LNIFQRFSLKTEAIQKHLANQDSNHMFVFSHNTKRKYNQKIKHSFNNNNNPLFNGNQLYPNLSAVVVYFFLLEAIPHKKKDWF